MPDEDITNLPILDDIIKPGEAKKAIRRPPEQVPAPPPAAEPESATEPAEPETIAEPVAPEAASRPAEPESAGRDHPPVEAAAADDQVRIAEPFLEDVIASYRPNIDSLTEDILRNIMIELEPLLRKKIRDSLKRHFPDSGAIE